MMHHAKWGKHEIGRHLIGGLLTDEHLEDLKKHVENQAAAEDMEHRILCGACGETFEPKPWPDNEHMILFLKGATLPGGEHVRPDSTPDGHVMEIPIAICAGCLEGTNFVQDIRHDWDLHDHEGKPLKGASDVPVTFKVTAPEVQEGE